MEIDINNKDWYGSPLGYDDELTRKRLIEIKDLGLTEVGIASFGIKGVMSGLYIEKVWGYDDEDWKDYINWIIELKIEKQKKNKKEV